MKKLLILLFLLIPSLCWGATFTVCNSGCNWTTIQGAFDDVSINGGAGLEPDDIVEVRADTPGGSKTYTETVTPGANDVGTSGHNTVIKARTGDTITVTTFNLEQNYITIDGFTITKAVGTWTGALLFNAIGCIGQNLTIKNVQMVTNGRAVLFYTASNGCILQNSTITENAGGGGMIMLCGANNQILNNDISAPNQDDDRDGMHVFGTGHLIQGNYFHDFAFYPTGTTTAHMDVIQTYADGTCGIATNITVEKNFIYNTADQKAGCDAPYYCSGPTFIMGQAGQNWTIRNNIIHSHNGVAHFGSSPSGFKIYNNTFIRGVPTSTQTGTAIDIEDGADSDDVRNNIIVDYRPAGGYVNVLKSYTNLTFDYNLYYNTDASTPTFYINGAKTWAEWKAAGYDTHPGAIADPSFVDGAGTTAASYKVQVGSPAIGAGATIATVTDDYWGTARPQGTYYDFGAHEYVSTTVPNFTGGSLTGGSIR